MSADAEIAALMLSNPELVIIDDGLPDGRVQGHTTGQIPNLSEQSERNRRNRAKGANFQSLLNAWMAANEWVFTEGHPRFNRDPKSGLWFPVGDSKNTVDYVATSRQGYSLFFDAKDTGDPKSFSVTKKNRHQLDYLVTQYDRRNKAGYLIRWEDAETRWHCISTRRGPKGQTFGRWDGFAVSDDELLNDVLEWYGLNPYE